MSQIDSFVEDFFELGHRAWFRKYAGQIPAGVTAETFAAVIGAKGLELRFIDKPDWTGNSSRDLPCYLVPEEAGKYAVYTIDRGMTFQEGVSLTLAEAIRLKAEILLAMASMYGLLDRGER